MTVLRVRPIGLPFLADRDYDYRLPEGAPRTPARGDFVTVPFGRQNRRHAAVVLSSFEAEVTDRPLKAILSLEDSRFSLSEELLSLALFLREHTFCSVGDAVRAMTPPAVLSGEASRHIKREKRYLATPLTPLLLAGESDPSGLKLKGAAQKRFLLRLSEGPVTLAEAEASGFSSAVRGECVKRGWAAAEESECIRDPYLTLGDGERGEIALSRAQDTAYRTLSSLYHEDAPKAALLFGVTGSGKTRVMMKLMDDAIEDGKGVILLVPEIALTPQTVGIFKRRYGRRVAVLHSSLGAGERFDAWRRIKEGEVDLVIGTRSAVFAPLPRLGLILIDEEHEHTYKSEADPRYHTRDVAAFRAGRTNSLVVFASATPSLESFYKAKKGIYTLVPLTERFGGATLPKARVVDLRAELRRGNLSPISDELSAAIAEVRDTKSQGILFLNRRGYHAVLQCKSCGETLECPSCSVALTHHEGARGGYLLCHVCGGRQPMPTVCPGCASRALSYLGAGTQKAEGALNERFPELKILRMDADTTRGKSAYDRMLDEFRSGGADLLLGTQMVTKGHDFPRVTLSCVLLADTSLHIPDFRASERTFSLLTQLIGRAGRASLPGQAIIQTFTPDDDTIRLACLQDYEAFYEKEIALRRELLYPPFCDMVHLTLKGEDEGRLKKAASALSALVLERAATELAGEPLTVYGPFEGQPYKAEGKYRMRMLIKCKLSAKTRRYFTGILSDCPLPEGIGLSIDCNPPEG